ncbi:hypothetical protein KDK95_32210, partial [Actinospica sp. MGRD01-02]
MTIPLTTLNAARVADSLPEPKRTQRTERSGVISHSSRPDPLTRPATAPQHRIGTEPRHMPVARVLPHRRMCPPDVPEENPVASLDP